MNIPLTPFKRGFMVFFNGSILRGVLRTWRPELFILYSIDQNKYESILNLKINHQE